MQSVISQAFLFCCFCVLANLAAFLVLDRPEDTLSGFDDARLRNPSNLFTFATVRNSDVEQYFKKNVELQTMYRFMQSKMVDTVEEAIDAVLNDSLDAFIWETSRLLYETTRDCQLTLAPGGVFGKSQYGIALRKQLKQYVFFDWRTMVANQSNANYVRKAESATAKQDSLVDKLSWELVRMHDSKYTALT